PVNLPHERTEPARGIRPECPFVADLPDGSQYRSDAGRTLYRHRGRGRHRSQATARLLLARLLDALTPGSKVTRVPNPNLAVLTNVLELDAGEAVALLPLVPRHFLRQRHASHLATSHGTNNDEKQEEKVESSHIELGGWS